MAEGNEIVQNNDHQDYKTLCADIGLSATTFGVKLNQLNNVQTKFHLFEQFTEDVRFNQPVSYLRDRWNTVIGDAKDVCMNTTRILTATECLSPQNVKDILDEIQKAQVQMAREIVTSGAVASAIIILVQIWRLHKTWVGVKDVRNVIEENGNKIEIIQANIDQLNTAATELRNNIIGFGNETITDKEKKKLMKTIRKNISRMNTTYVETRCMFSELKVRVDGKKQLLDIYQQEQISHGICNTANGVTNLIQYFQFSGLLSPGLTVLQGAITTAFFGLAAANAGMYYMTGKTLEQVREALRQIHLLDGQLRIILNTIHEAEDWEDVHNE